MNRWPVINPDAREARAGYGADISEQKTLVT
jgi:hypothetical protein